MAGVKLKISLSEKANWLSTISTKGTRYWYKFTGGNQSNNGDQKYVVGSGEHSFRVRFIGPNKDDFCFVDFYCFGEGCDQLGGYPVEDCKAFIVNDTNKYEAEDMLWGVYVCPEDDEQDVFLCHPRISNTWGPLED